jgi:hypothetical protein
MSSVPSFSSPSDFLDYIRIAYAVREEFDGPPDSGFSRIVEERAAEEAVSLPETGASYGPVVDDLAASVMVGCKARYGADLSRSCAFGPLELQTVNARCFISEEGHYAIVLHHGLMNILHKRAKLLTAAVLPASVTYCNRLDPSELTAEMLISWAEELGQIYAVHGVTKGAMVLLNPDATLAAGLSLRLSEAFVLGHEAGHAIAGHLEDRTLLVPDEAVPSLSFYPETSDHANEFEADRYGFEAMADGLNGEIPKGLLLSAVVSTFETLAMIGGGEESESHPAMAERVHRIVEAYFDSETAKLVHLWIDDRDPTAGVEALRRHS